MYERLWYVVIADAKGQKAIGPIKTLTQALQTAAEGIKKRAQKQTITVPSHHTITLCAGLYEMVLSYRRSADAEAKPLGRILVGRKEAIQAQGLYPQAISTKNLNEELTQALGPRWLNGHEVNH